MLPQKATTQHIIFNLPSKKSNLTSTNSRGQEKQREKTSGCKPLHLNGKHRG